ncbi:uncharacterized protein LOC128718478 [Anopheles marshallii]|uniref:uncharacterized protein LOC128718478 n=1 Tax=Anopheles marshallii TaxID=1521116 RepID=UPI00237AC9E3|nr:uncharacterized protein LOC128718478 [Anopheles marshallii]
MSEKCPSPEREATPLTEYQLNARIAGMGKLPNFTGEPEEWPLFYAMYRSSTASCGFSDVENALRLRQHLKGKAFGAVRNLLIYPSTVGKAIESLKTRFGRPELLCLSMLKKMGQLKAPQSDKWSTVMYFGYAVKDMCLTIKETGRPEYLNSYTLLWELVAKLPTHFQLEWAQHERRFETASLAEFGQWMEEVAKDIARMERS